jgi:predicted methyltransferase
MRTAALLLVLAAACGGSAASVPQALVLPVPPDVRAPRAVCPKGPAQSPVPATATAGLQRPRAVPLQVPASVQALVAAADRSDDDKKLDAGRHPGELLAFLGLKPGMHVAELAAGGGYTTELLARAVGPTGKVWSQNNSTFLKFVDKPWTDRLAKPVNKGVVRVVSEFTLPPDAKSLDAVVMVLVYHDTVWVGADRDKMNKAVFDALKKGGQYVVVDHTAIEGHGTQDVKTLHRIDELSVIREVERAGFQHAGSGDFLRNPDDTRDWNDSPREAGDRRGTSDRFVLKFVKP